jgi:hypothetical protein
VDVTQPAALAQQLATYNHVAESQLRYMVLMVDPVSNKSTWLIYTRSGNPFTYKPNRGSPNATGTSGATTSSGRAAPAGGSAAGSISKAQPLGYCVAKAGSDTARILACTRG